MLEAAMAVTPVKTNKTAHNNAITLYRIPFTPIHVYLRHSHALFKYIASKAATPKPPFMFW
jgi:hypothetical protein